MDFSKLKYKLNYIALLVLVFGIPLFPKLTPLLIILVLVTALINGDYSQLKTKNKSILGFTLIFVVYAFSLLYSDNLSYGFRDIETKLSLLAFPIAFFISKINVKDHLTSILKWFILGNVLAVVICIVYAAINFIATGNESELFYAKLSFFHHPSYFSIYLNLSLIILLYSLIVKKEALIINSKITAATIVLFGTIIILLAAKTGIITLFMTSFIALFYWVKKSKAYFKSTIILLLLVAPLIASYSFSNSFKNRIDEFTSTLTNTNSSSTSTSKIRIDAWKTTLELISKKPVLGYGSGDVKDILIASYQQNNLSVLADKKLNPHNQFLQTFLAVGLVGGLIFCYFIFLPLYTSIKAKQMLYLAFLLLFTLNILTESMLERLAGVIFYAFFNSLFFAAYFIPSTKKTT